MHRHHLTQLNPRNVLNFKNAIKVVRKAGFHETTAPMANFISEDTLKEMIERITLLIL